MERVVVKHEQVGITSWQVHIKGLSLFFVLGVWSHVASGMVKGKVRLGNFFLSGLMVRISPGFLFYIWLTSALR